MPYFSFSLKNNFLKNSNLLIEDIDNIVNNKVYFSKNTHLWKNLSKKSNYEHINFLKREERKKIDRIRRRIVFCLPPSIGLGDAVEYALAIKAVEISNKFDLIAVAYVGRFEYIFSSYFNLKHVYENLISENQLNIFDTIFHITKEIKSLVNQKYSRLDIESSITSFFEVKKFRLIKTQKKDKIKKITIFPISQSPIRSMPIKVLNKVINQLIKNFKVEVVFDNKSSISNFIENKIYEKKIHRSSPSDLKSLCKKIEDIEYGIFMDSGPLHLAKILNKKGIFITSSVGKNVLLNDFSSIKTLENNYKSKYCHSPCGLTNIFNYNNNNGCFDSLKITFNDLLNFNNLKSLQRGGVKESYIDFIKSPVSCLDNINVDKLIKEIKQA